MSRSFWYCFSTPSWRTPPMATAATRASATMCLPLVPAIKSIPTMTTASTMALPRASCL